MGIENENFDHFRENFRLTNCAKLDQNFAKTIDNIRKHFRTFVENLIFWQKFSINHFRKIRTKLR